MIFGRELVMGIVAGFLLAWLYMKLMVPQGAPAFPIIITYDKIGQARDRLGTPFNSPGWNPQR